VKFEDSFVKMVPLDDNLGFSTILMFQLHVRV